MEIIHIVLGKANPNRMNGVNKVVYQLATQQSDFGYQVAVWGITKDKDDNYGERNFHTKLFIKSSNPFRFSSELRNAILEKTEQTIFHIHGAWIPVFYSIAQLLNKYKIPFVFTPHGAYNIIAMKRNFWLKRLYFNLFEKKLLKSTNKIHCIGKSETFGLGNLYHNNKTALIPYGYSNNNEVRLTHSSTNKIVFGFIGRLDIYTKGLDILIKAFAAFVLEQGDAELWIVGDSSEKANLVRMIEQNGLINHVKLLGSKFGKDKDEILNQIDVFVHPSRNEGLPSSVIEAASFGKPCIVTDATNIGNLIMTYDAGTSIDDLEEQKLKTAMNKLFYCWQNPREFGAICRNAIRMVQEQYDWKIIIEQFNQQLYLQS